MKSKYLFLFLAGSLNINSLFAQTPSLEETLQWIKEKVEKYPSHGIDKVEFTWNENYLIQMTKFKKKESEIWRMPVHPQSGVVNTYDNYYIYEFELSMLSSSNIKYDNDTLLIYTINNSKSISYANNHSHSDCYCLCDDGVTRYIKTDGSTWNSKSSVVRISIFEGEPNLIERMKKAWQNAIAKSPKKQTNEKF